MTLSPDEARTAVIALTSYRRWLMRQITRPQDQKTQDEQLSMDEKAYALILRLSSDSSKIDCTPHPDWTI